jgi:hypothetical protein
LQAAAQRPAVPDAAVARFESSLGIAGLVDNHDVPVVWLGRDGAFAFARTEAGARRWFLVEAGETEQRPLSLPGGTPVLAVTGGTAAAPIVQTPAGPVRLDRASGTATPLPPSAGAGFVRHLPLFDQRVPTDIANPAGGAAATIVDGMLALRGPAGDVRVLAAADAPAFGWDLEAPGPLGGGQGVSLAGGVLLAGAFGFQALALGLQLGLGGVAGVGEVKLGLQGAAHASGWPAAARSA